MLVGCIPVALLTICGFVFTCVFVFAELIRWCVLLVTLLFWIRGYWFAYFVLFGLFLDLLLTVCDARVWYFDLPFGGSDVMSCFISCFTCFVCLIGYY